MSEGKTTVIRRILLLFGVVFVCFGAVRGEVWTVMMKAIYICMECIGIG